MGDYDAEMYVEGGEDALKWFNLSKDSDGWTLDMTQASFGAETLFTHTIKQAKIDVTFRGIGLPDEFYTQVTKALPADSFACSDTSCTSVKPCHKLMGEFFEIPDLTFTLGDHEHYSIPKELLLTPGDNDSCQFEIFNSWDRIVLGDTFLQEQYSVYDMEFGKIGLGPLIGSYAAENT